MRVSTSGVADIALALACVVVAGLSVQRWHESRQAGQVPEQVATIDAVEIDTTERASEGSEDARFGIIEFSDFQCPFCAKFASEVYPQLKQEFVDKGLLRRIHMNLPLGAHPAAREAAEGAECARQADKFWPMHTRLFAHQGALSSDAIASYAAEVGVAPASYRECMSNSAGRRVDDDLRVAASLEVRNTPTFYLGRFEPRGVFIAETRIMGAQSYEVFKKALSAIMQPAQADAGTGLVGARRVLAAQQGRGRWQSR